MNAKLLFFVQLCLLQRVLTLHDECDGATANSRMPSLIISKPSVYTALQCEDKCFREASCDGYNFKPMEKNDKYAKCELFNAKESVRFSFAKGFSSRWLNRTKIREKWVGKSCGKCNERQQCNREIDKCNPYPCKCKKGYVDDRSGTCYPGCTENPLLTQSEGNITKPAYLEEKCSNSDHLEEDFTCFYILNFAQKENVTFAFSEFHLEGASYRDCTQARQFIEFFPDNQPTTKKCANLGRFTDYIVGKVIRVKIFFGFYSEKCSKLSGFYKVQST